MHPISPEKYINLEVMENNPVYFGEALEICRRFGLIPIMRLCNNYDEELIIQFYTTVHFGGEDDKTLTWMTKDQVLTAHWSEFATLIGYPIRPNNGWVCHNKDNASPVDVLSPLYIPGWGTAGKVAHLQPTDRKSTRLNSSHSGESRMPSSA